MPDENPTHVDAGELRTAQRAIVLQLIRDDHPVQWTLAELEKRISDIPQQALLAALLHLAIEEALIFDHESVRASPCARHLDALELIAI
jgi:hypothetical protein